MSRPAGDRKRCQRRVTSRHVSSNGSSSSETCSCSARPRNEARNSDEGRVSFARHSLGLKPQLHESSAERTAAVSGRIGSQSVTSRRLEQRHDSAVNDTRRRAVSSRAVKANEASAVRPTTVSRHVVERRQQQLALLVMLILWLSHGRVKRTGGELSVER